MCIVAQGSVSLSLWLSVTWKWCLLWFKDFIGFGGLFDHEFHFPFAILTIC